MIKASGSERKQNNEDVSICCSVRSVQSSEKQKETDCKDQVNADRPDRRPGTEDQKEHDGSTRQGHEVKAGLPAGPDEAGSGERCQVKNQAGNENDQHPGFGICLPGNIKVEDGSDASCPERQDKEDGREYGEIGERKETKKRHQGRPGFFHSPDGFNGSALFVHRHDMNLRFML